MFNIRKMLLIHTNPTVYHTLNFDKRLKSYSENGAAAHFDSGSFFAISLKPFIGMMQMIHRWKHIDQALLRYVDHFL